ncbi:RNase adapter RapZ [Alkalibaculum sp. M08DMB]|uniref:RNase adapter RapZ n=1 Tax=Alkalibaculum sporogenes TaxID=2655001 RepID=A0A6A7K9Y9_9FIRM|nr:RNase adapter RapZ [Alkalibaculum sporogenes]MPW26359.1 RNase adapter RapZ [Alkalibaculum sporogenes]
MRFVIVTGLSGAGRSYTLRAFEDWGYFCVDNLPPELIPTIAELCGRSNTNIEKVALVVDSRGGIFFDQLESILEEMRQRKFDFEVLFLDATDEVLIQRFKETRRKHPLANEDRTLVGVSLEREKLAEIKKISDYIIDTSNLTVKDLKGELSNVFNNDMKSTGLLINVVSFGFKYGIPLDADLVFDVRFLPNPFYVEELRKLTGNDKAVQDYVLEYKLTHQFIDKILDLLKFLIPNYTEEGKTQLIIAIGCTGGQHRSVTIANTLYSLLQKEGNWVVIDHRDIYKHIGDN